MEEFDKQDLEQIAKEKEYHVRQEQLLDIKIIAIQKSTKTSFKIFNLIHNHLRTKWHWYYKWHLSPFSNIFHYTILMLVVASVASYGMLSFGGKVQRAFAASFTSTQSGNWSDATTWGGGGTPVAGDSVTIATGTTVTVTADVSVTGITIADSATAILTINTTKTLTASGTVTIGTAGFIQGAGTLALPDGAGATLSTTGTLNSLVQFTTATADVTLPARTYGGAVTITNGTASDRIATLGTATTQTINFSSNLTLSTTSTGYLWTKGQTYNPTVNLVGDLTTTHSGAGVMKTGMGTGTWTLSGNITYAINDIISTDGVGNPTGGKLIMNGSGKTINCTSLWPKLWLYDLQFSGNTTMTNYAITKVYHLLTVDSGVIVTNNSTRDGNTSSGNVGIEVVGAATTSIVGTITGTGPIFFAGTSAGLISAGGVISCVTIFSLANGTTTVSARTYYGAVIFYGAYTPTFQLGTSAGQTINFNSSVSIDGYTQGSGTNTIDGTVYNPNINIIGNLALTQTGGGTNSLKLGSGTWTTYGNINLTNSTITAGTSTLDFARMTGTQTFNAAGQTVGNVTHSGAGTLQLSTGAASVANLTLNQTYTKKKAITIDHTKVGATTEDEANFPMLVSLTDTDLRTTGNGGSVTNANGYDIIFADSNGVKLDHEIEKYDATTGEIIMWVRIPLLSKTSDTVITMLYGNTAISTSQEVKTGVWMNGYAMVQHIKETSGQHLDSTANANNSTTVTMTTQGSATGQIDGSDACNGTSDYVSIPSSNSLNFDYNQNFTISLWLKVPSANQPGSSPNAIISKPGADSRYSYSLLYNSSGGSAGLLSFKRYDGTHISSFNSSSTVNDDQLHLINFVKNGSSLYGYIGSTQTGTTTDTTNATVTNTTNLDFCRNSSGISYFGGSIDEIRFSAAARSAGWISTEYNNQNDPASFYKSISPALNSAGTATAPTIDLNALALSIGGNFLAAASTTNQTISGTTLTFNSTTAGHTITTNGYTLPTVNFSGTNGAWNLADNFTTSGDITINTGATLNTYVNPNSYNVNAVNVMVAGTLYSGVNRTSGTSLFTVSGSWSHKNGTFTYGKSTVNTTNNGTVASSDGKPFYNLTTCASGKTTTFDAQHTEIQNVLTLGGGAMTGGQWLEMYGTGTPLINAGTVINMYTIFYSGNSSVNLPAGIYGTLNLANGVFTLTGNIVAESVNLSFWSNWNQTATLNTSSNNYSITTTGNLNIGDGLSATLTTNNSTINVGGNMTVSLTGSHGTLNKLDATGTPTFNITGNFINNDTVTGSGAIFNITGSVTNNSPGVITANSSTWNVAGSVTNNAGATITAGTSTWNVGDNSGTDSWTNSGTFTANSSLVNLKGTGSLTNPAYTTFYNLTAAANGKTTTISDSIMVNNVLTVGDNTATLAGSGYTFILGSGTPFVTAGAAINRSINYHDNGATNIAAANYNAGLEVRGKGNFTYTFAGDVVTNSFAFWGQDNSNAVMINTNGHNFTVNGNSTIGNTDSNNKSNIFNATGNSILNFNGNLLVNNDGDGNGKNKLDLSALTGTFNIKGNLTNNDYFIAGNSTINFNGTAAGQTITAGGTDGNHDFNNITVANTHANGVTFADSATISGTLTATDSAVKKLTFHAGSTYAINGLNIEGNHTTRPTIVSSSAGTPFNITDLAGTKTVSYVDVKDCVASSEVIASESKDSGNNTNWMLVKTLTFGITSTTGHVQTPTGATITAKDGTGANTNAVGDGLVLSANHGNITPTSLISSNFTAGSWASNITLDYVGAVTVTVALHGVTSLTDTITLAPGVLDHFTVTGTPGSVVVQSPLTNPVIVTAFDAFGNVKIDYVGQMYFTSTDTGAVLPYISSAKYTFTGLDSGYHSFAGSGFTLMNTGVKTISAVDGAVTNASANITVMPAAIGTFTMTGYPVTKKAGEFFGSPTYDITVTAKDIFGNTKTDYTGIVWFTSTDSNGSTLLPYTSGAPYTFVGGDNGVKLFGGDTFKLATTGNQTITISDGVGGGTDVTSSNILITPADFDHFTLSDYPQASANQFATAGYDWSTVGSGGGTNSPYDVIVSAYDTYGNIKTDFVEPVWFEVGGGITSAFPYDSNVNSYTFATNGGAVRGAKTDASDNGRHIFDANTFTISTTGSNMNFYVKKNGYSGTFVIKIKPAPIASVGVVFSPILRTKPVDTALTESVIITAYDSVGNIKTDYVGDMYFTSSDTAATLPYTEQGKYTFLDVDAGTKTYTPQNTPSNYFNFHTGGNQTLTAVASAETGTVSGNSATFTISAHTPNEIQATAGYQQVILDWLNPTDPAVTNINIYQSTTSGQLGTKIASPNVNAGTYSQYISTSLTNGTPYYYTLASVVKTPQNTEYESAISEQVTATPADIAARNIAANQLADGRVKIDYDLRYTSNVSIDYYNPATSQWTASSAPTQTGDIGVGQAGQDLGPDLISHTAYWTAKTDFDGKYYTSAQGFKIRIKVLVPTQGNSVANSPSPAFQLDTKNPGSATLIVDASGNATANLSIHALEDGVNAITMMIANEPTFADKTYQTYQTSVADWILKQDDNEGAEDNYTTQVYIRFKDPYSNTTTVSTALVPVVMNFMLKDVSDLRVPAYQLFTSWGASSIENLQNYIVEYQTNDGPFSELIRTNQTGYVHLNLDKETLYSYRIKTIDALGNISRPSAVLGSKPGLAPDITSVPLAQVFGYKQDIGVKVIVKWNTDQLADSFVAFSTDEIGNDQNTLTKAGTNANIIGQLDRAQAHEISITNLLPGKKYYMKALSQNDQKITGYSNVFEINTPEYLPLQIKALKITELKTDSAWVSWETNKVSKTSVLLYGEGDKFDRTITDNSLNSDHKFKLEDLIPGVEYKLKIEATDEDGNSVASDEYSFLPPARPEVSGVTVSAILNNSATISWDSNVNTDSNVEYSTKGQVASQAGKTDLTTKHMVVLTGLESNTTYSFKAKSKDDFGNEAVSANQTFTTISDTTAPILTEIQSQLSQVTSPQGPKYQAVISWKTDEGSSSQVEYGDNAAGKYSKKTQEDASLNMTHVVILSEMKPNSAYSYRIISRDKSNNEAVSTNYTIITPPQEQSLIQVVIANLQDSFSWVSRLRTKWFKK